LVRLEGPLTILTWDFGTRRNFATAFMTASFALPS
jgi:hypothetical protein